MPETWTRDELLVTFNLYCKIPFSKTKASNPSVTQIARLIGRSPASVAMKLGNLGSFDPALRAKGIRGLSQASKGDRAIWEEFNQNWDKLSVESELATERLLASAQGRSHKTQLQRWLEEPLFVKLGKPPTGPSETTREVKVRLHQRFFHDAVMASYGVSCCVCSNPVPKLLTAGHIIPLTMREDLRANPRNGLCLCSLHHNAFDCGLWTLDDSFKIILSSELTAYLPNRTLELNFVEYLGVGIHMPDKFWPETEFLAYHRLNLFRS